MWLAFSGGEIFLRDDIVEITNIFYGRNRPAIILLPTNGLLPELIRERVEAILRMCKKSTVVVKLSLDGLHEVQDSLRGVKGAYEKTMKTYRLLGELIAGYPNFELGINTVFCSENQGNMDDIIDFVNDLDNIKTHTISLIRGDVSNDDLKDVDIEKYHKTIRKLEENLKKKIARTYRFRGGRLKAAQDILQRRLIYETRVQKRQLIPCFAGRLNLVLTETGALYPCESFDKKMGNVRDHGYDIKRLLKSEQARKVLGEIRENKCYCTHECYLMTNIIFNASTYPSLIKEYMQL
jgi:radical SAM protein with 4Fe4S-binding SPASM domain